MIHEIKEARLTCDVLDQRWHGRAQGLNSIMAPAKSSINNSGGGEKAGMK